MHDPSLRVSNEVQTPGMPFGAVDASMGFPAGTSFDSTFIATNTTPEPANVELFLQGTDANTGAWQQWSLGRMPLGGHETATLSLAHRAAGLPIKPGYVGVRAIHDHATPGAVVSDLVTKDESLFFSFFDPMFDTAIPREDMVAVSFNLSGAKNTLIVVKNTKDIAQGFNLTLWYLDPQTGLERSYDVVEQLGPQELTVVDIGRIQALAIPDLPGGQNIIPQGVEHGWANILSSPGIVIGDPTVDTTNGTCQSCGTCGGTVTWDLFFTPTIYQYSGTAWDPVRRLWVHVYVPLQIPGAPCPNITLTTVFTPQPPCLLLNVPLIIRECTNGSIICRQDGRVNPQCL